MTIYYAERRGVLAGGVRLVTESPDPRVSTPVTLTAEKLEYQWEAGLGVASGGIAVRQGERRAYADRAHYKRDQAVIDMEGNVRFERGKEDWLTADRARMDLDAETITASGGVLARMLVEESKASRPPVTPPEAPVLEPDLPLEPVEAAPPATLPGLER
ncbi:MAG: LptA/OstA family protein [Candidatus Eremiobacterota bacterium]